MTAPQSPLLQWLQEDVKSSRADVICLVMAFSSALIDTVTLPTLNTFVANLTGNILLLGLGAAGLHAKYPDLIHPSRSGVALGASMLGSFVAGHSTRHFNSRSRWWLFSQFAFEALLIYICAILFYTKKSSLEGGNSALAIIALSAFSYGSQSVSINKLGVPMIPAQVLTGATAGLLSDPQLFALSNPRRNQRVAFIVTFFVGCVVGGLVLIHVNGGLILILTASLKFVAATFCLLMPKVVVAPTLLPPVESAKEEKPIPASE